MNLKTMNLKTCSDQELLTKTKELVEKERDLLIEILHHLRELERRKLYCDLGCGSLFEYCCKVLGYSEGQSHRRIQAMRLLRELPQIEDKIADGSLSLSNIAQASSCFLQAKKANKTLESAEKLKVLEKLENQSTRQGQRILLDLQPQVALPQEREKWISSTQKEVNLIVDAELEKSLEEVRSLLGIKGLDLSLRDLVKEMAGISAKALKAKRFGKKRAETGHATLQIHALRTKETLKTNTAKINATAQISTVHANETLRTSAAKRKETPQANTVKTIETLPASTALLAPKVAASKSRAIPKAVRYRVWIRDQGQCTRCASQRNLHMDHIKPFALGGLSTLENLRLLCFHCNQRQAMKTFGLHHR